MQLHPAVAFAVPRSGGSLVGALLALPSVAVLQTTISSLLPRPCYRRHRLTLNQPDGKRGWTREPRVYGARRDVVTFDRR